MSPRDRPRTSGRVRYFSRRRRGRHRSVFARARSDGGRSARRSRSCRAARRRCDRHATSAGRSAGDRRRRRAADRNRSSSSDRPARGGSGPRLCSRPTDHRRRTASFARRSTSRSACGLHRAAARAPTTYRSAYRRAGCPRCPAAARSRAGRRRLSGRARPIACPTRSATRTASVPARVDPGRRGRCSAWSSPRAAQL